MSAPLRSMTGFGRASGHTAAGDVTVEVRTVNHRGLDVKLRARDLDGATEHALLAHVRQALKRGSITLTVETKKGAGIGLDQAWFVELMRSIETLRATLSISEPANLGALAAFAAVVKDETDRAPGTRLDWSSLEPLVVQALAELDKSRLREGAALAADLRARRQRLAEVAKSLEARCAGASGRAAERLRARLAQLGTEVGLEPQRLAQEIALQADRSDVTEELVRLGAHLNHMSALLEGQDSANDGVGRRLDFWVQEIGREFNTLTSKSQDAEISALVVDAKAELEKLREQAQNIE